MDKGKERCCHLSMNDGVEFMGSWSGTAVTIFEETACSLSCSENRLLLWKHNLRTLLLHLL